MRVADPSVHACVSLRRAALRRGPVRAQPKRAMSAFLFFSKETRPTIVAESPYMPFGDVGKTVGERWRALTDEQRQPYLTLADEDKQRYADQMSTCK